MSVHKDKKNKTKDGRIWYFKSSYKDESGKTIPYKSKKFKTKFEAKEAESLYDLKNKGTKKYILFETVANDFFVFLSGKGKESTYEGHKSVFKNQILPYFKNKYITEINTTLVNNWKDILDKKNLSVRYKNKAKMILSSILDYACAYYDLEKNVAKLIDNFQDNAERIIKDDEKLRYITLNEFNLFISVIDDISWKTFFIFLFYTGCRKGEVQALTWHDINLEDKIIIIDKTLSVKTKNKIGSVCAKITSVKNKKNRKVKISKVLYEQLIEYKKEMSKYTDFNEDWFVFGCTRFFAQTSIDNKKHEYFLKANLQDREISIHEFRHSHVSLLINEYVKVSKEKNMKTDMAKFFLMMSERMGHTVSVMQKTYMHLLPTIQDEIVDLLDNL